MLADPLKEDSEIYKFYTQGLKQTPKFIATWCETDPYGYRKDYVILDEVAISWAVTSALACCGMQQVTQFRATKAHEKNTNYRVPVTSLSEDEITVFKNHLRWFQNKVWISKLPERPNLHYMVLASTVHRDIFPRNEATGQMYQAIEDVGTILATIENPNYASEKDYNHLVRLDLA